MFLIGLESFFTNQKENDRPSKKANRRLTIEKIKAIVDCGGA